MEVNRYKKLQTGKEDNLTDKELKEGWRFCNDCDGLLININRHNCPCLEE